MYSFVSLFSSDPGFFYCSDLVKDRFVKSSLKLNLLNILFSIKTVYGSDTPAESDIILLLFYWLERRASKKWIDVKCQNYELGKKLPLLPTSEKLDGIKGVRIKYGNCSNFGN